MTGIPVAVPILLSSAMAFAGADFQPDLRLDLGAALGTFAGAMQSPAPDDIGALAAKSQNPVADLISVPFQNNTAFDSGIDNDVQNVLNIQPVIPVHLGELNLINRIIVPVVYQPALAPGESDRFGLGDINYTAFFSPADTDEITWGIGPAIVLPTATAESLGRGKLSLGPSAVIVATPKPWVLGVLWNNVWSVAGDSDRRSVNSMLVQYFVNYNLPDGWYLTTSPIITADWTASSSERWVVPFGGGFGRVFRLGDQPVNVNFQAFYNVADTTASGEWSIRLQLALLFPN